jgi:hypothetical protein
MEQFRKLIGRHLGVTFIIMGGGPTLEEDLSELKGLKGISKAVYISCNGHGTDLRTPEYVMAMDDISNDEEKQDMVERIRALTDVPIIGPFPQFDFQLEKWPHHPERYFTGMVAVWAAFMMGAGRVIVAGMDSYWSEEQGVIMKPGMIEKAGWINDAVFCPVHVATIYEANALLDVWPRYEKGEHVEVLHEMHPALEAYLGKQGEIEVVVVKDTNIYGAAVTKGQKLTVDRTELQAARLLRHGMIKEIFE